MTEGVSEGWGRSLCGRSLPPIKSLPAYNPAKCKIEVECVPVCVRTAQTELGDGPHSNDNLLLHS